MGTTLRMLCVLDWRSTRRPVMSDDAERGNEVVPLDKFAARS
jgi:hypothetical protein